MTRPPAWAQGLTAVVTYPADGAVGADLTQPIMWTSVPNAEAYYLYVGTTRGAKDVVDTGEIHQTSYIASQVPSGQTLYARLFTKLGGIWTFSEIGFTAAAPSVATIIYPVNGATNADLAQPIQWTNVPNVEAYYLYVGSTPGAKNIVDTGEIHQTSYLARNLPVAQTIYARLFTKIGGVWRFTESSFSGDLLTATITYPPNGASGADLTLPIQWTSVPNAQAYYLYVGTAPGAKNLVDTGEIQQTSYLAQNLPVGQTVYARLFTKSGNTWHYTDISFSATFAAATITYPANGATDADLMQAIQWTSVPSAQAYYLYVGSSPGAKNLVDTGEILQTSYVASNLPIGQTVFARLFTKVGGVWRYKEISYSGAPLAATITYPANGAVGADLTQPIQWTSVPNAQAYYLYVGSTPGSKNLIDSGEIHQTTLLAPNALPAGQTLYVRIYVKVAGSWRYTESTFSAAPLVATFIYPVNGATNVDITRSATWTNLPTAEAYYLYIGSTPGAKDIVDSRETHGTSYPLEDVPAGRTLYARLHTKLGGQWRSIDSTFVAAPIAAEFLYPQDGATGVTLTLPFRWTSTIGAEAYRLHVGSTAGGSDLLDSGELSATSYLASALPASGVLYARIWTKVHGAWTRHSDVVFTPSLHGDPATILMPANGATKFDTSQPFQWSAGTLARGYRLTLGTAPGGNDVHDSGEIGVTQRFVPNLPVGVTLFGRLYTKIDSQWFTTDFTFQVTGNGVSAVNQVKSALWATNWVRTMASLDGRPSAGTELLQAIGTRYAARDADYAGTLLRVLGEMNLEATARRLDVAFDTPAADTHTLVELLDPASQRWMVLDPVFDATARRSDGVWASADELSAATRAANWSAISYVFLGPSADAYVRGYRLDYPLLFLNVYHQGQPIVAGQGTSPLPFLQSIPAPVSGTAAAYAIRCSTPTDLVVDGVPVHVPCDGIDSLSAVFTASDVAVPSGTNPATIQLYRVPRFVF